MAASLARRYTRERARMRQIKNALLAALSSTVAYAGTPAKTAAKAPAKAPAKTAKKATPAKKAGPPPMVSAEHKKALAEKFGGFKFGMTKDEVLGVLQKQIDERYEDKIKATTDIAQQDRYRKDKKAELSRVSSTYVAFGAGAAPWGGAGGGGGGARGADGAGGE